MTNEKPSIMLVEDEIHLARGICFNLEEEGFRISHFDSGEKALACLLYTSPSPRDRTRSRMPSSA